MAEPAVEGDLCLLRELQKGDKFRWPDGESSLTVVSAYPKLIIQLPAGAVLSGPVVPCDARDAKLDCVVTEMAAPWPNLRIWREET